MKKRKTIFETIVIGLLLWVLVGFIVYPAIKTLFTSLTESGVFSLENYRLFFSNNHYRETLQNTVILGLLTVLVCGGIGTLMAFSVHYFRVPFRGILDKLLLLPLVLPGLIIVFAFVQLYGESGLVTKTLEYAFGLESPLYYFRGLKGILFVHAYTQYIYFYMNVSVGIKHLDMSAIEAARSLGATKRQVFIGIILPYLKPALISSSIITFMTGIGSFSAPSIIGGGYRVMTTQILLAKANNYMGMAAAQVILLVLVSMIYLVIFRYYESKVTFVSAVRATPIGEVLIKSPVLKAALFSVTILTAVFILLPVITILLLSFVKPGTWMIEIFPKEFSLDNYLKIFTKARAAQPFINSIRMASGAGLICMLLAVPASYLIVKTKRRARHLIEFLVMLPWAMPASAIAINSISAFSEPNVFAFNTILTGTAILLPLAYFVSFLPLMVRYAAASLQSLNDTYMEASRCLGAGGLTTFLRVVLPIAAPGIIAGLLLVFIRGLGEYSISVYLYNVSNRPISIAMVNAIFEYDIGLSMAYGSLILLFAFAGIFAINKLTRRRVM